MHEAHPHYGVQYVYSKYTILKVNLIQKNTFTEISRIMYPQYHSPVGLKHKIGHPRTEERAVIGLWAGDYRSTMSGWHDLRTESRGTRWSLRAPLFKDQMEDKAGSWQKT